MDHYVGIDVSLEQSSVCVVDQAGQIVREAKVASEPEALIGLLADLKLSLARVGLEAGPLSQWLHAGLMKAGHDAVLLETRHVTAALSAMIVKTDRRDARASHSCCGWAQSAKDPMRVGSGSSPDSVAVVSLGRCRCFLPILQFTRKVATIRAFCLSPWNSAGRHGWLA